MVDGHALPEAKVVGRELAGVPKVEVVGLSKEKVEELFGRRSPRSGPIWQVSPGKDSASLVRGREQSGISA